MRWRPALAAWAAALALAGGCSAGGDEGPPRDDGAGDGGDQGGCDRIEPSDDDEGDGEVALGTGYEAFEPLDDDIPIIAGPQGGFHLNLNARVRGLDLGDPDDLLDPENPSTAFGIYTAEGERLDIDTCPVRVGYRADGDEGVLPRGVSVVFEVAGVEELVPLFDGPVLVRVEVVDSRGRYAADERTIVVRAPVPAG